MGAHNAQRSNQSRQILYLSDKETINLWRIDNMQGFGFGVVNLVKK